MIRISLIILVYTHMSYGRLTAPSAGMLGQRLTSKHVAKYLPVPVANPSADVTENSNADIAAKILPVEDVTQVLPADDVAQILSVDKVAKIVEGVTQFVGDTDKTASN
ncbi:hypothetical protein HA402_007082 [Bradysia odoriphaga]|nr:hypothetical protein HA402_007082 [Bradysia odoriphaga]